MGAAFVCKAFDDVATLFGDENPEKQIRLVDIGKFGFCLFNPLVYNKKIRDFFAASFFLELLEYYTI